MFTDDALTQMPLVNRERAQRLYALTLEQFWTDPKKADANIAHLENLIFGLRGALELREAAVRDGL